MLGSFTLLLTIGCASTESQTDSRDSTTPRTAATASGSAGFVGMLPDGVAGSTTGKTTSSAGALPFNETGRAGALGVLGNNAANSGGAPTTLSLNDAGATSFATTPGMDSTPNMGGAPGMDSTPGSSAIGGNAQGGVPGDTTAGGTAATDTVATGGMASGGSSRSTAPTNGGIAFGGSTATGDAATGGATIGPSATAGASIGSTATAGATTGGVATGGFAMAGTTARGGVAGGFAMAGTTETGGVATGGAATDDIPATGLAYVPNDALSCSGMDNLCQGENCCTSIKMPGGKFAMGRSEVTGETDYDTNGYSDETPEHRARVAAFALDKYEVTVGRYRAFVAAYDSWHKTGGNPTSGAGAHPVTEYAGWGESWFDRSSDLEADSAGLIADFGFGTVTWTDSVAANESYPLNFVNWYTAFAFCIWDGGRLPTEVEWEYAAAGGDQNRLYPWGSEAPDYNRANFYYSSPTGSSLTPVGSKLGSGGAGYFGHADLAGSMNEWVLDWYSDNYYGTTELPKVCIYCANTIESTYRVVRGGSWRSSGDLLRAAFRDAGTPSASTWSTGFRCARDFK